MVFIFSDNRIKYIYVRYKEMVNYNSKVFFTGYDNGASVYQKICLTLEAELGPNAGFDVTRKFYSDKCGQNQIGYITGRGVATVSNGYFVASLQDVAIIFEEYVFPFFIEEAERQCVIYIQGNYNKCKGIITSAIVQEQINWTVIDGFEFPYESTITLGTGVTCFKRV